MNENNFWETIHFQIYNILKIDFRIKDENSFMTFCNLKDFKTKPILFIFKNLNFMIKKENKNLKHSFLDVFRSMKLKPDIYFIQSVIICGNQELYNSFCDHYSPFFYFHKQEIK